MAYVRPISKTTWYLDNSSFAIHMLQELTSLFVGAYALVLLWGIAAVAGGTESYQAFLNALQSPLGMVFHWLAVIVIFYHAIAWFKVTPQAMPVQIGEEFLPGSYIAAAHYVIWAVLSLAILFFAGVF